MGPIIVDIKALRPILNQFSQTSQLEVTESAEEMILLLINSGASDPHETWEVTQRRLEVYEGQWRSVLPVMLNQIAKDNGLRTRLTAIDVVYWTGQNLTNISPFMKACPFPGPGEVPDTTMSAFPWNLRG